MDDHAASKYCIRISEMEARGWFSLAQGRPFRRQTQGQAFCAAVSDALQYVLLYREGTDLSYTLKKTLLSQAGDGASFFP